MDPKMYEMLMRAKCTAVNIEKYHELLMRVYKRLRCLPNKIILVVDRSQILEPLLDCGADLQMSKKDAFCYGLKGKLAIYFSELDLYAVFTPAEYKKFITAIPNEIIDCAYVDYCIRNRVFICSRDAVTVVERRYCETEATIFALKLSHGRYCVIVDDRTIDHSVYDADELWTRTVLRDGVVPEIECIEVKRRDYLRITGWTPLE